MPGEWPDGAFWGDGVACALLWVEVTHMQIDRAVQSGLGTVLWVICTQLKIIA